MSLSPEKVRHVARLARIAIAPEDIADYSHHLSRIMAFVDQLEAFNTRDIPPMAHPQSMTQRLRPDEVTAGNQREAFQKIAPAVQDGLYLVPQVIE